MSNVLAIAKKQLSGYFNSPIAYIVIVLYLVVTAVFFFVVGAFFVHGEAWLRPFFSLLPWTLIFFVPPITMRQFAEEKKLGTIEVLMTLPIRDTFIGNVAYLSPSFLPATSNRIDSRMRFSRVSGRFAM